MTQTGNRAFWPFSHSMLFGVLMIVVSIIMLRLARPRYGVVVGFLRDREGLQAVYTVALMFLFVAGCALVLSGWR